MVTTVEKIMEKYTIKSIEQSKLARKIQQAIGYPTTTEFINYFERGDINYYPVNKANIHVAEDIFGPDIGSLKGKTVRRNTIHSTTRCHQQLQTNDNLCRHNVYQQNNISGNYIPPHQIWHM